MMEFRRHYFKNEFLINEYDKKYEGGIHEISKTNHRSNQNENIMQDI